MKHVDSLQTAQAANFCVKWLKSQGIKVMRVEGDEKQPRIIVKHNARCDFFEGIVQSYERSQYGERRRAFVHRFGCEIKWTVKVASPHKVGGAI
jgi:hypothetical protein